VQWVKCEGGLNAVKVPEMKSIKILTLVSTLVDNLKPLPLFGPLDAHCASGDVLQRQGAWEER
jgi:hypothetical protein